jgi:hypothetical protein
VPHNGFIAKKCPAEASIPGQQFDRDTGGGILWKTLGDAGGTMNANLMTVKTQSAPPEVPVTTVFLKPTFGITVQSNTLSVSVKAHAEGTRPARPPARG